MFFIQSILREKLLNKIMLGYWIRIPVFRSGSAILVWAGGNISDRLDTGADTFVSRRTISQNMGKFIQNTIYNTATIAVDRRSRQHYHYRQPEMVRSTVLKREKERFEGTLAERIHVCGHKKKKLGYVQTSSFRLLLL